MSTFRKKALLFKATQWFKIGDHPAVTKDHPSPLDACGWLPSKRDPTLGNIVFPGDFILEDQYGNLSHCKDEMFSLEYELVQEDVA